MWTLLFDIDGTLIRTRGAGFLAIGRAMSEMFDVGELPTVPVHGRTDRAILQDLFDHFSLDLEAHVDEFHRRYWSYLPETMQQITGVVLPGVRALLAALSQRSDVALGLLTGNARVPAFAKLRHFQLDHFFRFGGFGDVDDCRNRVAHRALEDARDYLGPRFENDRVWVIGDTVHDINCARSIGSRVVAVETGNVTGEQLADGQPDVQLCDLSEVELFVNSVLTAAN